MKKRIVSFLLAVMMVAALIPFSAFPASAAEVQYPIVISGDATYSDMTIDMTDKPVEHIFVVTGQGVVFFNNITFINVSGTADGSCVYVKDGGGITFQNCRFINCSAKGNGGAVYVESGLGIDFIDSYAVNCHADGSGGFLYNDDDRSRVVGRSLLRGDSYDLYPDPSTVISGCSAGQDGGAIYLNHASFIDGFVFADNTAAGDGGALCNTDNDTAVKNCRFYRNTAAVDGGGLYTDGPTVETCRFFENECSGQGSELYSYFGNTPINNCSFLSNHSIDLAAVGGTKTNCETLNKDSFTLTEGVGSKDDPYIIDSTDDWDALHYMVANHALVEYSTGDTFESQTGDSFAGKYLRLENDIIACNTVGESKMNASVGLGITYNSRSEFRGTFDGNRHTVSCYMYDGDAGEKAAFGYANGATVKNLYVNGYVRGSYSIGAVFGAAFRCTAENCTNNAVIDGTGDYVGGIAGYSSGTSFWNCTNNEKITAGGKQAGGIAGRAGGASLKNCVNHGDVTGYLFVGGLIGYEADAMAVRNSIVTGKASATAPSARYPAEGDYVIYSAGDSDYCFDIEGASEENGIYLKLRALDNCSANVFTLTYDEQYDCYTIAARHSGRFLTADAITPSQNYVDICQYWGEDKLLTRQRWTFESDNNGNCLIRSVASFPQWYMNVANGTVYDGVGIIAYRYRGNDSFRLVPESDGEMKPVLSDAITGRRHSASTYEQCFYRSDIGVESALGIGLSENAMNGVRADIIGGTSYLMPDVINDAVLANAPGTEEYMPVYFDGNNVLNIAHSIDETVSKLGVGGKTTAYCAASGETSIKDRPAVRGNVLLFLKDGSTLKAEKGITLGSGNTLTVYASGDPEKAGALTANGSGGNAAIGGVCGKDGVGGGNGTSGTNCGTLYLYGGRVTVSGGSGVGFGGGKGGNAGGVGNGGNGGSGGTLYLYGGRFKAFGSDRAVGGGVGGASGHTGGNPGADGKATGFAGADLYLAETGTDESHASRPFTADLKSQQVLTSLSNDRYVYLYPHAHAYDRVNYAWSEDHLSCTATLFCSGCPDDMAGHVGKEVTVEGDPEYTPATCFEVGYTVYTAHFSSPFESQTETVYDSGSAGHSYEYYDSTVHKCRVCKITENHTWETDRLHHTCSVCNTVLDHVDSDRDDRCDVCGYLMRVTYLEKTVVNGEVKTETKTLTYPDINVIRSSDETWGAVGEESRYVLDGDVSLENRPTVLGNVDLILTNGKTLTANHGITVESGNTLSICAESDDEDEMGVLRITTNGQSAIGGKNGAKGDDTSAFSRNGLPGLEGCAAGSICFCGGKAVLSSTNAVTVGGGNGGNGGFGNRGKGGDGANGGAGGQVYFYGGCQTLGAVNASAIGGGKGGSGGKGEMYGKDGGAGADAVVTVFGIPALKAGADADSAKTADAYDGQAYLSVSYAAVHEHTFTFDWVDNGDGTHSGKCVCGASGDPEAHTFVNGVCVCGAIDYSLYVSAEGAGSVTVAFDGTLAENITSRTGFAPASGTAVTLTAVGEGFRFWKNNKNGAILSTDAVLTLPGTRDFDVAAVFNEAEEEELCTVYFKDTRTGRIVKTLELAPGTELTEDLFPAVTFYGYTLAGWKLGNALAAGYVIGEEDSTLFFTTVYARDTATSVVITVKNAGKETTVSRPYAANLAVKAKGENFSYWTLDGKVISLERDLRFCAPGTDCTLEAVYEAEDAPEALAATVDLSLIDNAIYFTVSRSVPADAKIVESGVLLTRKATAEDLTVDTALNTVTRGYSTAPDADNIVGFVKDVTNKPGTWLVRGYVTYQLAGETKTVYTAIGSIVVE